MAKICMLEKLAALIWNLSLLVWSGARHQCRRGQRRHNNNYNNIQFLINCYCHSYDGKKGRLYWCHRWSDENLKRTAHATRSNNTMKQSIELTFHHQRLVLCIPLSHSKFPPHFILRLRNPILYFKLRYERHLADTHTTWLSVDT